MYKKLKHIKKGLLFIVIVNPLCFLFSQEWDIIYSIDDLEKMAKGASSPAVKIAYYLGGVLALFALARIWKKVQEGDDAMYKIVGAWISALFIYLAGVWVVDKYVM